MILCQSDNLDFCFLFVHPAIMAGGHPFDLPYSVELWDEADELIALTGDYNVARAAYQEPSNGGQDASSP
jgi:hypothetical protein